MILFVAAVVAIHGIEVMLRMREIGAIQQRFHAELMRQLGGCATPLSISAANPADCWLLERFLADIPSYRGAPLGDRARVADCAGTNPVPPDFLMSPIGSLVGPSPR